MRAETERRLPPVMPQGNLVEVLGREVRQGAPGELMVESTPSRQRRPPCKTNKEESDEAADAAALTYLLTPYGGRMVRYLRSLFDTACMDANFLGRKSSESEVCNFHVSEKQISLYHLLWNALVFLLTRSESRIMYVCNSIKNSNLWQSKCLL